MSAPVVAVVHLGRHGGGGQARRVQSWEQVLQAAGIESVMIPLLGGHRSRPSARIATEVGELARGLIVPEAMSWSFPSLRTELERIKPAALVLITARAYRPVLAEMAPTVVLDLVDRLSASYRQRTAILRSPLKRAGYQALVPLHRRFEVKPLPSSVVKVAAGWSDASALGASWLPITVDLAPRVENGGAVHDIVFFGTLSYAPNIDAVARLAQLWPAIIRRRPGTTALLAGASPGRAVVALAKSNSWTLIADFSSLSSVLRSSRLAVVPLLHTAGIQCKVLEAAAHGLPQVVTPAALAGFQPGFPVTVADSDEAFTEAVVALLEDHDRLRKEGSAARGHVSTEYSAETWAPRLQVLLGDQFS